MEAHTHTNCVCSRMFSFTHIQLRIAKTIMNNKRIPGGIANLDFKLYCSAIEIKAVWYWHKHRRLIQT